MTAWLRSVQFLNEIICICIAFLAAAGSYGFGGRVPVVSNDTYYVRLAVFRGVMHGKVAWL